MKRLTPLGLSSQAVAVGATTPDPGGPAAIWSTTAASMLIWNGSSWQKAVAAPDLASPGPIGATTPGSGSFTSLATTGSLSNSGSLVDAPGFRGIPQNAQSAAYTLVLSDAGKHIYHPVTDNNPRTFTIPANASVAFPIGTAITFINMVNVVTIAIASDILYFAGTGTTSSRTLAAYGTATAVKLTATTWMISGAGLT
jgi:hypothetical protein